MMPAQDNGRETAAAGLENPAVPWAESARYDRKGRRVVVLLSNGLEVGIPIELAQGLAAEKAADLEEIEISPAGLVLHWPKMNTDLHLPALLNEIFGPPHSRWDAYWSRWRGGALCSQSESRRRQSRGGA